MFNHKFKSVLLVFVMLIAAVGGGMAAASYDNETTSTSTTSDLVGGETVTDLDNSSKQKVLEVQSDNASSGDDFTLKFIVNDTNSEQDGEVIHVDDSSWTATNSSAGYYNQTFTHAEVFEDLERDAGEDVTVDVVTVVNESETSEEEARIQITASNDADSAVATVYENEDLVTIGEASSLNPLADTSNQTGAAKATQYVDVNANNTTSVHVNAAGQNLSDAWSASASDFDSGQLVTTHAVYIDGELYPAVKSDASDVSWLNTSADTYAVVHDDGDVTVENANATFESDGIKSVKVVGNQKIGFWAAYSMLSDYNVSNGERVSIAFDAREPVLGGNEFEDDS